ncbi:MAG: hypothetical protein CVV52_03705 [Spirochaetae bacterium HGW-Spirochaetae-8]|nr:MAG: hypothetical protein CVV52_03705 [Spirochaetae bacterium HGW-Spirochaetae-8]
MKEQETVSIPLSEYLRFKRNFVTMKDIAAEWGVTPNRLHASKWRIPNFGQGFGHRKKSWTRTQYEQWCEIPIEERRRMYEELMGKEEQAG